MSVITVIDNGKGIPPDVLPHIFERFRQGDGTTARRHNGLGMGLAMVRHLVELHGGTVHAFSSGEGSQFTITLPLAVADAPTPRLPARRQSPANNVRPQLQDVKILVVEDEPDSRDLVSTMLQYCGAEVTAVATADEAMQAVRESEFHVLVSDIALEGGNGYDLVSKVRALGPAGLPAVAVTAYAREEDRRKAFAAGYQEHVAKPVDFEELAAIVADLATHPPRIRDDPETSRSTACARPCSA
jgi:CheY-like chemotaxis protein